MDHEKRIDKSVSFVAVNIAVLTVSDSRSIEDDKSGDLLAGRVAEDGHHLADRRIVTDDFDAITANYKHLGTNRLNRCGNRNRRHWVDRTRWHARGVSIYF